MLLILSPDVPDVIKMLAKTLPPDAVKLPETIVEPVAVALVTVMSAVESIEKSVTRSPPALMVVALVKRI